MSDIEKILILAATLWVTAIGFIIFSWVQQARQQQVIRFIALRLAALEKRLRGTDIQTETTQPEDIGLTPVREIVDIPKDAPIAAYESLTLPDAADIHFVDTDAS